MLTKTINYRGGVVVFRIPSDWVEEYDDYTGGVFYSEASDLDTLRLSITTASNPNPISLPMLADFLGRFGPATGKALETLPTGNVLLNYVEKANDQGDDILVHFWLIGNLVTPNNIRIANFSFTCLASQTGSEYLNEVISLLDREIRQATFSPKLGV